MAAIVQLQLCSPLVRSVLQLLDPGPCAVNLIWRALLPQVDTDFTNDDDVRAILIVHDTRPPFLDGRVTYTKQAQVRLPV